MYYVYVVTSGKVPRYVGKGSGSRWKHAVGGTSTCRELNKDYFDGKHMEVYLHSTHRTSEKALQIESSVIEHLFEMGNDLYNKRRGTPSSRVYDYVDGLHFLGCNCETHNCFGCWPSESLESLTGDKSEIEGVLKRQRRLYLTRDDRITTPEDYLSTCIERDLMATS